MNEIVEKAFSYLDLLVTPPLKELGGLLADQAKMFRYKNQLRLISNVEKIHKKRGIAPRKIPLKLAYNLIDEASWEEDENLVNMWSQLLANATDSKNPINFHNVFVKILSELSSQEASLLSKFISEEGKTQYLFPGNLNSMLGKDSNDSQGRIIANNLERLGILQSQRTNSLKGIGALRANYYILTDLGRLFIKECSSRPI
ncbi:Abi-alpha family protein [Marinoscillum sp.]|uniref:Abi-alpha family protein n=1 Tax=Marinoscillum sp. TaxID=2024838 RepID=UPI003BAC6D45